MGTNSQQQGQQELLSTFGGGDTDDLDLSIDDSDGRDSEGCERVREYAESVVPTGWEVVSVNSENIWFSTPDYQQRLKLTRRGPSWAGRRLNRPVGIQESDLQDAIDAAVAYIRENLIDDPERD